MNEIVVSDSLEKIWSTLFNRVKTEGQNDIVDTDLIGHNYTKECLNQHFVLTNMKNNLMFFPGQNIYLPFLITDFHDLLTGKNPGWALKWHPASNKFCDQNGRFLGHYGERIRQNQGDQLLWCYKELRRNPTSRQVVLSYYYPVLDQNQPYPPCTLSQQFMIRDDKLDTFVLMRSNDLLSGGLYDWTHRALLTHFLASWLNIEARNYYHTSQSLHLYVKDYAQIKNVSVDNSILNSSRKVPEINSVTYDETKEDIYNFDILLHNIERGIFKDNTIYYSEIWTIWSKVMQVFGAYKRQKNDIAKKILLENLINSRYFELTAFYFLKNLWKIEKILDSDIVCELDCSEDFVNSFIKNGL